MKKLLFLSAALFFVGLASAQSSNDKTDPVFNMVEEMPTFKGGDAAMMNYLSENLTYPEKAKVEGVQGTVFVTFVVNKEGKIVDPKVARGVSPELDNEAQKVVATMPNWRPGKMNGKPVSVQYNLPIRFKLDDK